MNAIDGEERNLCFAFDIEFLQKKQKAFVGFFFSDKFFFWVREELKLERDGEI